MSSKAKVLIGMNNIVKALNHEGAYFDHWIYIIPDEADDDELEDIADNMDDIFQDAVECFGRIMRKKAYVEGGLYLDKKVYTLKEEDND